ncbi:hypothetical protein D9619_008573 [Psilocybe cf. subviscida]|uniref:Uncharacterized protein n=1 Tax=Psilocybe cf. subviscida TaxID=2480587 RepID=A0A8H5B9E7_9AGAR|nr:hypothetical protein D9619_008573 [Psilocybe cf. subviscida]
MVSNKTVSLTLLTFLCASSATAKFSFSREQLRQFDMRRRHTTAGPSNAFRPVAAVSTVTVTVSTTSTTTSTATTTSITTSQTTASTTVTDTITTGTVPDPAVVQMHTTHIAILPRATTAAFEKPRMRKVRRSGTSSRRDGDQEDGTLSDVPIVMPPSENIAAMKQVHRQRAAHSDMSSPSGIHVLDNRARPLHDAENAPVDVLTGILVVGHSTTTTTNETESNINGELDSTKNGLVHVAESDATTTSTDTVNNVALPVLAVADGASSVVDHVVKTFSPGTSTSTNSGTLNSLSVVVSPFAVDLL